MKNVHVLPTDKEPVKGDLLLRHIWKDTSNECISWWRYKDTIVIDDVLQYTTLNGSFRDITSSFKVQNIYITSDERIERGDWVFDAENEEHIYRASDVDLSNIRSLKSLYCKKITLTTDQDLIKDGVQAIDDEFLEWFVKNSSCESVGVTYGVLKPFQSEDKGYLIHCPDNEVLEEPKQDLEKEMFELEQELNIPSNLRWHNSKPKQETLEEFAKQEAIKQYSEDTFGNLIVRKSIEKGAKWQAERMYSEEYMLEFSEWVSDNDWVYLPSKGCWVNEEEEESEEKFTTKELFNKFKNK